MDVSGSRREIQMMLMMYLIELAQVEHLQSICGVDNEDTLSVLLKEMNSRMILKQGFLDMKMENDGSFITQYSRFKTAMQKSDIRMIL